jgi:hypothetical protein
VQPLCSECAEKAHEEDKKVPANVAPPAPKSASAASTNAVSFDDRMAR